ncbi:CbtB domain-containing protein [Kaistia terrae]|jgi:cobalt transporter subunit CbtB|uniref:CbtB domain-containing protein n=1 Tax=Kaistia terrae TaxID=537017 RepID=A0ABW0Q111_9HYPH|nr:CbtB domain-containing protein [Kaistia terrae]MCX5578669.1 CbtB-domain containing protein [Kaistia terrae]
MTQFSKTATSATVIAAGQAQTGARMIPALVAVAFGIFLFVGTGFAAPSMVHNATHDTRHALGLPCH